MSKKPYTATDIKNVDVNYLNELFEDQRVTVGVDVAKDENVACLMGLDPQTYVMIKYDGRTELDRFVELLRLLTARCVELVLEPSGTYGDPLRAQAMAHGLEVFKMRPSKCGHAKELFDHVPSLHDGKSAYLIARLHRYEISEAWKGLSEERRRLQARIGVLDRKKDSFHRLMGPLEGWLGRHWPEVGLHLKLSSASLLELLIEMGSPEQIARRPDKAKRCLRKASKNKLSEEKIATVVQAASQTMGMKALQEEVEDVQAVAKEMRGLQKEIAKWKKHLKKTARADEGVSAMIDFSGVGTACVLVGMLGSAHDYEAAAQYEKGAGINLKVKSSGRHHGQLRITKRGPGKVRKYLYLLACRKIQKTGCPYVRAWYLERLKRNGGCKLKALVAVMRKLIRALYHIGQGATYDPYKLFDVNRLEVMA